MLDPALDAALPGLVQYQLSSFSIFPSAPPPTAPAAPPSPGDGAQFTVQASLRISAPDDAFEQEADQMASAVMDMSPDAGAAPASPGLRVQRAASAGDGAGLSTSPAAEIEVYDAQGVHIGTKNPVTGEWIGSAVAGRMLRGL